jgi:hypothetical protein
MTRSPETSLKRLAQERMGSGQLPRHPAARMWGSHGHCAPCALCGRPIGPDEIEYEVEMRINEAPDTLHFHRACHSVWHTECEGEMAR